MHVRGIKKYLLLPVRFALIIVGIILMVAFFYLMFTTHSSGPSDREDLMNERITNIN